MELLKDLKIEKTTGQMITLLSAVLMIGVLAISGNLFFSSHYSLIALPAIPVIVVLHEGLHGIFFWTWTRKVKFGAFIHKNIGLAFYSTSSEKLSRNKFIITTSAPQLLTITLLIIYFTLIITNPWVKMLILSSAAMNLGGGAADFYVIYNLFRFKPSVIVEDYKEGIKVYNPI